MMKRQWPTLGPRSEKKNFEKGKLLIHGWAYGWHVTYLLFVHGREDQTAEVAAARGVSRSGNKVLRKD
jgi:hypothetical protein